MADLIHQEREPLDGHGIEGLPNIDGLTLEGVGKLINFLDLALVELFQLAENAKDLGYDDIDARLWVNAEKAVASVSAKSPIDADQVRGVKDVLARNYVRGPNPDDPDVRDIPGGKAKVYPWPSPELERGRGPDSPTGGVKGTDGKTVLVHRTGVDAAGCADAHLDDLDATGRTTSGTACPDCQKAEVDFRFAARRTDRLAAQLKKEQHDDDS